MATKLKNIKYGGFLKSLAFILVVGCLTAASYVMVYMVDNSDEATFEEFIEKTSSDISYMESRSFASYSVDDILGNLLILSRNYKNEANIRSGNTLPKSIDEYPYQISNAYDNFKYELRNKDPEAFEKLSDEEILNLFNKKYPDKIKNYDLSQIDRDINRFRDLTKNLDNTDGLYYYLKIEGNEYFNSDYKSASEFKSKFPFYLTFDKNGTDAPESLKQRNIYNLNNLSYYPQDVVYLGLSETYLNPKIEQWKADIEIIKSGSALILSLIAAAILFYIYLLLVAGRTSSVDKKVDMNLIDRLYLDIHFVLLAIIMGSSLAFIGETFNYINHIFIIPIAFINIALSVIFSLSCVKHLKNKSFIRHTFIYAVSYKVIKYFWELSKNIFKNAPLSIRTFPTPARLNDLYQIINGIEEIKDGGLNTKIQTKTSGIYAKMADDLNNISGGLKLAVNNELKSERLKTELISNVSHDIRTPLTSIITYVDLLKKEEIDSETVNNYVNVLDQKSKRLKTLIDDLFDASKASSGNVPVVFEKIDVISLLNQGMGELDDKITESKLEFKLNLPEEKVFINADGKLFWRVIENMMSNIFKYAMPNSRVYLDVLNLDNSVAITFKNISAYELNIDSEELMERFKRGDESRTTEGSGLGLSIAKSLVELQKGYFEITIDGDLFKNTIIFPKYEE